MKNPPMPETTKKATKRTRGKLKPRNNPGTKGMGRSTLIGLTFQDTTGCIVADEATEKRLKSTGPSTSTRYAGYNYVWGETEQTS